MKKLKELKVALVHDYLKEYGGAERVLTVLGEMFPQAPIYTAFVTPGSSAAEAFRERNIIPWSHEWLINRRNLHSPLRFLIPQIWESFDFSGYDLVISSASGYITKGIITHPGTTHICYCHTPPRFLYGYPTAREWQRWWPVRLYGSWLVHTLRQYDYWAAQRVEYFVANSENVRQRIKKFYRKEAEVIYPPVNVEEIIQATKGMKPQGYYLAVSRLVGAKGLELILEAAAKTGVQVKIVGEPVGQKWNEQQWSSKTPKNVEWMGRVSDAQLWKLYGEALAFLALGQDEDFGITPVEAMAAGRPVIAYGSGGYLETVVEGQTGHFFYEYSSDGLAEAIGNFEPAQYQTKVCRNQAQKFSKERFVKKLNEFIERVVV